MITELSQLYTFCIAPYNFFNSFLISFDQVPVKKELFRSLALASFMLFWELAEPWRAYKGDDFLVPGRIILLTEEPNVTKEM